MWHQTCREGWQAVIVRAACVAGASLVVLGSFSTCEGGPGPGAPMPGASTLGPEASAPGTSSALHDASGASPDAAVHGGEAPGLQGLFAEAYHLDAILGEPGKAEPIYEQIIKEGSVHHRETALSHLRLAALCQARGDQRCAMQFLDWLINHARQHPDLARAAEQEMVDLLHPQAGRVSALTRGPPASFTRLLDVPSELASQFRDAEQALLRFVRASLAPQLHNMDAVVSAKRGALVAAIRAYDPLVRSQYENAKAAGLFRQGSLHQDFAEALGRLRLPEELLPRVAAQLRRRFHAESVTHFRAAVEHYRSAAAVTDVAAEPWRQAAAQGEAQLGRFARRVPPQGPR